MPKTCPDTERNESESLKTHGWLKHRHHPYLNSNQQQTNKHMLHVQVQPTKKVKKRPVAPGSLSPQRHLKSATSNTNHLGDIAPTLVKNLKVFVAINDQSKQGWFWGLVRLLGKLKQVCSLWISVLYAQNIMTLLQVEVVSPTCEGFTNSMRCGSRLFVRKSTCWSNMDSRYVS